jgi:hypothetical protein
MNTQRYVIIGQSIVLCGIGWQLFRLTRSQKNLLELADIFTGYMQIDLQEEVDEQFDSIVENYDDTE